MTHFLDLLSASASALVIVAMLAWCYGAIHRRTEGRRFGPVLLGAVFGLVAAIQMHMPIEAVDGLTFDLRVVPVVLAGAFLGSEGLAVCLVLAAASRVQIGGLEMVEGLVSILIAGIAGLVWSGWTSSRRRRGILHFAALGGLTCLSLVVVFLLPRELPGADLQTVLIILGPVYLAVVPVIAMLMEKARLALVEARRPGASSLFDPESGLPTKRAFAGRVSSLAAEAASPPVTSVLVLALRQKRFLQSYWGQEAVDHVISTVRTRVEGLVEHSDLIGCTPDGNILVGLTAAEGDASSDIRTSIERAIADRRVTLPGGEAARVTVWSDLVPLSEPGNTDAVLADLTPATVSPHPFRCTAPRKPAPAPRKVPAFPYSHDGLFDRLDRRLPTTDKKARGHPRRTA